MAEVFGTGSQVFWGKVGEPAPNWRDHPRPDGDEDDPPDEPLTPEGRRHLAELTGLDSAELFGDSAGELDDDDSAD